MERGQTLNEIFQLYDQHMAGHQGNTPTKLLLPVRYACNLMLEGVPFWGDFYSQIQQDGLRALGGQRLLGMEIEIVIGPGAPLRVE